ncbi:hypothetical protein KGQ71_05220, partial [Patescibacteria group bacterium]|nr:hypothetical protein [Patescibacteria group bacterium]
MEQVRFVERRITTQKDLFTQFPVGIHGDPARIRQASQAGPEHKRYLKSGSHSSAYRVNLPDRPPEIVKVIHRLNPFSDLPSAIDFAHQIWDYGHILNDRMGIPTIVPHTVVIDSIDTGYYVQTMEEDGGTDFETSMGESNPH